MIIGGRRASFLLFLGDIVAFALSLHLTLFLRYGQIPDLKLLTPYLVPFSFLFALWAIVFYSAGLYSKRVTFFQGRLTDVLLKTQIVNILFAALFFFLIPTFGIAPKTILALYLVVSLLLILLWRLFIYPNISSRRVRERATLLAEGNEAEELLAEVNGNRRYGIEFFREPLATASMVIIDEKHTVAFPLQESTHRGKQIVSFEDMYEEVFDRIPLSQLGRSWFSEHAFFSDSLWYVWTKRVIDIIGGLVMGIVTLLIAPGIALANAFESPGPLFIKQIRFGRYGERIPVYKFRSMQKNLATSDEWTKEGENRITKVGAFLRRTSLDEFPQCINVILGQLSLIGPRSDILGLGERLAQALPYYEARYLIVPGITGWAQINQQYEPGNASPQSVEETKVRLAYDFYYLKHRSLGLDIVIALKTIKRMFFRVSSW